MLSLHDIRFQYPGGAFCLALKTLEVRAGESLVILGPSGGGKTTLLRLMTGLLSPDSGEVICGETRLNRLSPEQRRRFRLEKAGLVFQDFALLDYLTVEENILLPSRFSPLSGTISAYARELADRLEIASHWRRRAAYLSQGERQRVAIARALAHRPQYVFADEPTASLDTGRRGLVMDLLLDYTQETQASLVMVTHDAELMPLFQKQLRVEDLTE
ncbi:putative ABC transport system ATP-binding protein [Prosthecobacter fusiformis]|uniref:Putative ABC transport system ATP-binding protein n=1 Tax=Prosthecobacter fusiformis TaxID=48464 RepID=A0A4R7S6X7_9BACT|nr:ATP-binding cassette domain-containing protein [Prosthecobacter fusiformis]TDU73328.1 putative ABC transport system ATP-binding protein [Prosthecobacter fusiformis]